MCGDSARLRASAANSGDILWKRDGASCGNGTARRIVATRCFALRRETTITCTASHLLERRTRYAEVRYQRLNDGASMTDNSMTGTFQINLPKDLLSESKRATKVKSEQLHVEGWRNSWLSRIAEMVVGKD